MEDFEIIEDSETKEVEEVIDDSTKREYIIRYFDKPPTGLSLSVKFLLFCIVGGIICLQWEEVIGYLLLTIAILYFIYGLLKSYNENQEYRNTRRASDEEYDQWLDEDVKNLETESLNELGIDKSELVGESVSIYAPRINRRSGAALMSKFSEDDYVLRYTPIDVTIIHFTEHQLISYRAVLDFTTGKPLSPSTDEYFYNDIISASTTTESYTERLDDGTTIQCDDAKMFKLVTSGGTSISVRLDDYQLVNVLGGAGELPTEKAENAIKVIRRMLRDKKSK